ncbi:hypothetical protein MATL_G00240530 [Megalops atlanticus]|uniref:Ig-like domain-containing protein n=1 Tax=Megalops atlanticus TaxID=7932 RepID=A0A9D3PC66_MEGAT|nr:hypothetical protein MATL_G00240530 [Megalops atlanticus]
MYVFIILPLHHPHPWYSSSLSSCYLQEGTAFKSPSALMTAAMDCWHRTANLLLLTVWACVSVAPFPVPVIQSPVEATLGSSLTLRCNFQLPAGTLIFRVNWSHFSKLQNTSKPDCALSQISSSLVSDNQTKHEQDTKGRVRQVTGDTWSELTLTKVSLEDSGRYVCCVVVEAPFLKPYPGNGTNVIVVHPSPAGSGQPWWVWVVVGVGCALLHAGMVGLGIMCKRMRRRKMENVIYINTIQRSKAVPNLQIARCPGNHMKPACSSPPPPVPPRVSGRPHTSTITSSGKPPMWP